MRGCSRTAALAAVLLAASCTRCSTATQSSGTGPSGQVVTQPEVPLACEPQQGSEALNERASPYDSTRITIGSRVAQVCYSRPSAKGRVIFGGLVPLDRLWRTGANEPTIIHLPFAAEIAGLRVEPGSYSLYTVPGATEWSIIVNRSISQWGHESQYKPDIQAQEIGRAKVEPERLEAMQETFTIRTEAGGTDTVFLVLEWERTRVRVPVRAVGS
ncbi:MAG: DUF2911 domain-containing protein [Longimicrobiales bacterium]